MSAKKSALGRGFETLLPTEFFDEEFDPTSKQDEKISSLLELELDKIEADADQPRKNFDNEALKQLSESIKVHGVLQPIVVVKQGSNYKIVAGERRFRASKLAGKTTIPAIVRKLSDQNRLELSLIENIQRSNLSVIEVATSYLKLRDQFNLTLEQIGQRVGGKTTGAISNTLRLLRLPKPVIEALDQGRLTEGQAKPLIGLGEQTVLKLAQQIEANNYSARQVERLVQQIKNGETKSGKLKPDYALNKTATMMTNYFKTKVVIRPKGKKGGKIEISYKDQDELKRIEELLAK